MDEMNYAYNGKFEGNILIAGRMGCGKTTFVQNLGKNKLFGGTDKVLLIFKVELSKDREGNIRDCFVDQKVDFFDPNNVENFNDLLEFLLEKSCL